MWRVSQRSDFVYTKLTGSNLAVIRCGRGRWPHRGRWCGKVSETVLGRLRQGGYPHLFGGINLCVYISNVVGNVRWAAVGRIAVSPLEPHLALTHDLCVTWVVKGLMCILRIIPLHSPRGNVSLHGDCRSLTLRGRSSWDRHFERGSPLPSSRHSMLTMS